MRGYVSEAAREEETLRYGASLLSKSIINNSADRLDHPRLCASHDAALAAFAQLSSLRLHVDRTLISLFAGDLQHIVAEATRSTIIESSYSDGPDTDKNDNDVLLLPGTAIPRSYSACEHVLDLPPVESTENPLLPISVVPDLTQNSHFCTSPYYHQPGSPMRFYAGVPLRTRRGIDIGVCCILDSQPRQSLDPASQHFLRHLSHLVMSHLQSRVSEESYRQNDRMVRGLGSLVEGTASISRWQDSTNPQSFADVHGKEGALNARQQLIQTNGHTDGLAEPLQTSEQVAIPQPDQPIKPEPEAEAQSTPEFSSTPASEDGPQPSGKQTFSTCPDDQADNDLAVLKSLFSRAANIIRESIEVEGALFLDASIESYGGLVRHATEDASDQPSASSSGYESAKTDGSTSNTSNCGILGYSTSTTSSINGDTGPTECSSIPETFLAGILRHYPEGQIFIFAESGSMLCGTSDSDTTAPPKNAIKLNPTTKAKPDAKSYRLQRPRRRDGVFLRKMFPEAKCVAVFPLWDSHNGKWHAGGFVWTKSRSRVFTREGELSYLRAFGSTIMAEVARIDVLRADKAKEDVLGSLSHEIRSPLHGIILGLELMHDTPLSGFQYEVLNTVETCGRTLLDTMDHLLDFSKVNHFLRSPKRKSLGQTRGLGQGPESRSSIEAGMRSLFSNLSLDALLEEVVESVYAGFSFQETSTRWATRERNNTSSFEQAGTHRRLESVRRMDNGSLQHMHQGQPGVAVYINIDPTVSWDFHAQPGALRRIMMNIFGNALKYTKHGSILVSLTQQRGTMKTRSRRRTIIFTVSDSGKGISSDFLQNRLFTPFTQENQLSTGSGLGLSIVKQIVHGLGGRITVESAVGYGTTVRVSIPLRLSSPNNSPRAMSPNRKDNFRDLINQLEGVTISLFGFPEEFEAGTPHAADTQDTEMSPKRFMDALCRHCLHLDVSSERQRGTKSPTIYICTEAAFKKNPEIVPKVTPPVLVVICDSVIAAHELSMKWQASLSPLCISQPIGPRKLSKALTMALKQWAQSKDVTTKPSFSSESQLQMSESLSEDNPNHIQSPLVASSEDSEIPFILPDRGLGQPSNGISSDNVILGPLSQFSKQHNHDEPSLDTGKTEYLVVDDNSLNVKILAAYIDKLGRGHGTAMNGLEALEACRARPSHYSCIFMDISMPVMDGLEATRHIRALEKRNEWKPALVIAMTGLASAKTKQEAFASGVDIFLTKPVPFKDLSRILESRGI